VCGKAKLKVVDSEIFASQEPEEFFHGYYRSNCGRNTVRKSGKMGDYTRNEISGGKIQSFEARKRCWIISKVKSNNARHGGVI